MALDTIEVARAEIAQIYIAAFNRVPDAGGLSNWMNQYMAGKMTYAQIAEDFTKQAEYVAKYPTIMTNTEYVTKIYNNVFGRTPDAGGLTNWVNQLDATSITHINRGNIMTYMLASAGAAGNTDGMRLDNQAAFAVQSILDGVPEATATAQLANITSDATTVTAATTAVSGSAGNVLGESFTLTKNVDTFNGTSNNDTFVANYDAQATAAHTLGGLDTLNGSAGIDTLAITDTSGAGFTLATATISNIEKMTIRGDAAVTADVSGSTITGLTSLSITQAAAATATAATTTAVSITGATGAVTVDGGSTVSVVNAGTTVTIGATTGAAGAITVTDTAQGASAIDIDGGTSVNITTTATNAGGTTGTIKVGQNASPILPTGAVTIVDNLTNAKAAATNTTGGAITVTGGTTVSITETATQAVMTTASTNSKIVQGAVTVTGSDVTTSVTVNQTAKVAAANTVAAVTAVTETTSVVFSNLTAGQTLIVGGLTFTSTGATTAAQVAAAFANLTNGATSGTSILGTYTGTFTGWSTGAATGTGSTTVVFTSSAAGNVADLAFTGTGQTAPATAVPALTKTDGVAAVTANAGTGGVDTGVVQITDKDYSTGVNSITTATINGYKTASYVKSDALTTLSLANSDSAATFDVYNNTATTLAFTLDKVVGAGAVSIDAGVAKYTTLNVTTTGSDSAIALTAAAVTALTVTGTKALDLTGSTLSALKTVTVSGSAGLKIDASGSTVTDVNASATSGNVTATIDATKATYEGGTGVDTVTTSAVAPTKAISLGDGNDKLTLVTGTTSVTGAISGGNGTDTLVMVAANAVTASGSSAFATKVTGFEKLQLNTITTNTVDLATLGSYNYVVANGTTTALTLNGYGANGSLELNAANTTTTANLTDATGSSDVFNIVVTSDTNGALNAGTVVVANVETLNVSSTDSDTTTGNTNVPTHTLAITDTAAKSITLTGDAQLTVTTTGATALTTVNASAMTAKLVYDTTAANATVTAGSGNDALTASTAGVTLIGGAGNDTLTSNAGVTTMTGGAGNDLFIITTPTNSNSYSTITDFSLGDTIRIANAATFDQTKMTVLDTSTFTTLLNAATAGNATNALTWFQYSGNTYIVEDHDAAATFQDGADIVVKITGLVDLSTGILNANDGAGTALTIH